MCLVSNSGIGQEQPPVREGVEIHRGQMSRKYVNKKSIAGDI